MSLLFHYPVPTSYLRAGTIGLKARYLLSCSYMATGRFSEAKALLEYVHSTLKMTRQYAEDRSDTRPDIRVLNDLVYCNMRQGNFRRGLELFAEQYEQLGAFFPNEKTQEKQKVVLGAFFMKNDKEARRRSGLNNLIACALLADEPTVEGRDDYAHNLRLQLVKLAFDELDNKIEYQKGCDPETKLLKGYYTLLTKTNIDDPTVMTLSKNQTYKFEFP